MNESTDEPIHKKKNLSRVADPNEIHEMTMINGRSPHPDTEKHH